MKIIIILSLFPFCLFAQDQVTIDLRDRSITINSGADYESMSIDSNYNYYNHNYWGGKDKKDTFLFVMKDIVRKKNITTVIPALIGTSYKLSRQLEGKSWQVRDSMLNTVMQRECKWKPSQGYFLVSYVVTPVKYYQGKYPYIDIHKTYYEKYNKKRWYTSQATRIFIIGKILYYVYLRNFELKTDRSIFRSRKAVCCDFKRLVNNIKIIEAEEGCGGT